MSLHDAPAFECEICEHLPAHGWLHEDGSASALSRELAPYAPDLLAWISRPSPETGEMLQNNRGSKAEATRLLIKSVLEVRPGWRYPMPG